MRVERCFAFVDLCGFTAFIEHYGDERTVVVLADFRTRVREIAARRGVRVTKWLGTGPCSARRTPRRWRRPGARAGRHRARVDTARGAGRDLPRAGHHVRRRRLHRPGHQRGLPAVRRRRTGPDARHPGGRQPRPPLGGRGRGPPVSRSGLRPAPRSQPDLGRDGRGHGHRPVLWSGPPARSPASTPGSGRTAPSSASVRRRAPCPGRRTSARRQWWSTSWGHRGG